MWIEIRKDRPIPEQFIRRKTGRPCLYPWKTMDVGDSFDFPKYLGATALTQMYGANKRYAPRRFNILRDEETGIYTCWRVE